MTNYNERLDTILAEHREWMRGIRTDRLVGTSSEATKQAITSLIKELVAEARIEPFNFVEPCEPDCDDVRHAYHQCQWDMATRIEAKQEEEL